MASFFRSSAPQAGAPQTDAYGNPIGQRPSAPASGAGSYSRLPPPPTPPRQQEPPASNYSRPSQPLQRGRSPIPPPRNAYGDEKSAHRPSGVGVRGVCVVSLPPSPFRPCSSTSRAPITSYATSPPRRSFALHASSSADGFLVPPTASGSRREQRRRPSSTA